MIKKYVTKPVEAIQFTGMNESEIAEFAKNRIWVNSQPVEAVQFTGMNESEIAEFAKNRIWVNSQVDTSGELTLKYSIETAAGEVGFDVGDYLVKTLYGDFEVVQKDIFDVLYKP